VRLKKEAMDERNDRCTQKFKCIFFNELSYFAHVISRLLEIEKYDSNVEQMQDVSDLINRNESFPLERESEPMQQAGGSGRKRRIVSWN
jgi:hypothetical protein